MIIAQRWPKDEMLKWEVIFGRALTPPSRKRILEQIISRLVTSLQRRLAKKNNGSSVEAEWN